MAEYIERERAIQKVKNVIATEWFRGNYEAIGPLQRVVDVQLGRMTAADVAPVVHAHNNNQTWIGMDEFRCSECGVHIEDWVKHDSDDDGIEEFEFKFCPNCGAVIDEGDMNG